MWIYRYNFDCELSKKATTNIEFDDKLENYEINNILFVFAIHLLINEKVANNEIQENESNNIQDPVDELISLYNRIQSECYSSGAKDSMENIIKKLRNSSPDHREVANFYAFLYYEMQYMYDQQIEIGKDILIDHKDANVLFSIAYSYNAISELDSSDVYVSKTKKVIEELLLEDPKDQMALVVDVLLACLSNAPILSIDSKVLTFCNSGGSDKLFIINLNILNEVMINRKMDCLDISEMRLRKGQSD